MLGFGLWRIKKNQEIFRSFYHVIRENGPIAKKVCGKGIVAQALEIVALHYGIGRLAPDEYYQYCLYNDKRFNWKEKKKFFGRQMEDDLVYILNAQSWSAIANDKLITYALLEHFGFPIPRIYAVYHSYRSYGSVPAIHDTKDLENFIRTEIEYPFISKPVWGMWGKNVLALQSYDRKKDLLILKNGKEVSVEHFVAGLVNVRQKGILFQELLKPHIAIKELCGDRICSIRMVVIIDSQGPRLISTLWKVATGQSMADNYWEPGNMVGPIESETGRVGQLFTGLGYNIKYISEHPDTGRTLVDINLPDWKEATELCLSAARSFPGIPMQAWDIALTSDGPVLLEVNVNGGMRLPQLVKQAGLFDSEFRNFLKNFNFPRGK